MQVQTNSIDYSSTKNGRSASSDAALAYLHTLVLTTDDKRIVGDCLLREAMREDAQANKVEMALERLSMLEEDWDGYGSPAISRKAISNCRLIVSRISNLSASAIQVLPTEYGGVQMKKQLSDGRLISCDFGDDTMSYYIEKDDKPEYFPFLSYSETNVQELAEILG